MHADPIIARGAHTIDGAPDNFEVYTVVSKFISMAGAKPAIEKCNVDPPVGVLQPACVIQTDRSRACHPCQMARLLASPTERAAPLLPPPPPEPPWPPPLPPGACVDEGAPCRADGSSAFPVAACRNVTAALCRDVPIARRACRKSCGLCGRAHAGLDVRALYEGTS